jgi:hypothetical protein
MSVGRCDCGYRSARNVIFLTAASFERQAENRPLARPGSRSEKIRSERADVHGAPFNRAVDFTDTASMVNKRKPRPRCAAGARMASE